MPWTLCGLGKRMQQNDPAETGAQAAELVDDYLEKVEKHAVPSDTRQLLFLADGVHLYPEELSTIAEYLHNRQDHLQATSTETGDGPLPERTKMLPPGLGKPPPLLPTPSGPRGRETPPGMREHSATPLMTSPGPYPKTKPPPLLSMHQGQGPPHGPPPPRAPLSTHGLHGPLHRGPPRPPRSPTLTEEPSYGTPAWAVHLSRR
ncbi:proline-rich protein HaeIII subfamily 1-like [Salvelinus namaycush]|uniref:Proline-rich protein HaeIII subfamily 1-like n=1 Tax=Salvelinus namaycush TaxID=8040 RepID=A0A8U1FDN6_SALNM|nr:proline-rich protein HaeIII subfamily 1-like [Salvelinus namaycush]XP_038874029.1 proline-rich protein HaeIII subfamily 1-like [Salvelinus namaycush]XP_038874030.1 proline-rich protein HaeIII subfamily 1-like [Salvelinus namaycush]